MKTKEFILLILIIAVGVVFTHIYTEKWDVVFGWEDGWFLDTEEFSFEESKVLEPPFPSQLQIINDYGDIEIIGTEQENIQIQFTKRIRRRKQERAQEIAEGLEMVIERNSQQTTLSNNRKDVRRTNLRTDFIISVPAGMDVLVKNRYGQVKASRLGEAEIIARNGKVVVWDISKKLTVWNSYEDIEADNVGLGCQIDSRNSEVQLSRVKGNTLINQRYGTLDLEDLQGNLYIDAPHSKIFAKAIAGPLEIENSYEKVSLFDVGPTIIRGNNSPITIDGARENVEIHDRYSQVRLENIQGNVEIQGRDLNVFGKGILAERIYVSTSYQDVTLEDFSGKTTIALDNGKLKLSPAPLTHPIEIKGSYADIKLFWPGDINYPFEAQANSGEIHWNLAEEPTMNVNNGVSILKAFQEEPFPYIRISTSYADITIDQNL